MANNNTSGGVSVASLLGVLFVGLKLGGIIDWSWWWVTAPFWIPITLVLSIIIVAAFIAGMSGIIVKTIEHFENKRGGK